MSVMNSCALAPAAVPFPVPGRESNYGAFVANSQRFFAEHARFGEKLQTADGLQLQTVSFRHPPSCESRGSVVLVHGLTENIEKYHEIIYDFYHAGYDVHMYDQRGHADSSHETDRDGVRVHERNFDNRVTDLMQFLRERVVPQADGKPVVALGHSMGGMVLARTLALQGENTPITAAVLSSPMLGIKSPMNKRLAEGLARLAGVVGLGDRLVPGQPESKIFHGDRGPREVNSFLHAPAQGPVTFGAAGEFLRVCRQFPAISDRISVPMMIMRSGHDSLVEGEAMSDLAARTGAQIVDFPDSRHEPWNEDDRIHQKWNDKIVGFFEKHTEAEAFPLLQPDRYLRV